MRRNRWTIVDLKEENKMYHETYVVTVAEWKNGVQPVQVLLVETQYL